MASILYAKRENYLALSNAIGHKEWHLVAEAMEEVRNLLQNIFNRMFASFDYLLDYHVSLLISLGTFGGNGFDGKPNSGGGGGGGVSTSNHLFCI